MDTFTFETNRAGTHLFATPLDAARERRDRLDTVEPWDTQLGNRRWVGNLPG